MYGMHNQGKFLKLPPFPQDQVGTFRFLLVLIFGYSPCTPSIGLEDSRAHIEALTIFTQQALNDSQKNMSLMNTEMSSKVEWAKLSYKVEWPWTLLLPQKEAPVPLPKQNVFMSLLMYHLY